MGRTLIQSNRTKKPVASAISMAALLMASSGFAQQTPPPADAPPPPPIREPLPPKVTPPEDDLAPEVVIRQEEGRTVEEYVSNGRVYMVRIVPAVGVPYYLIDTTGDGLLDMRHETFEPVKPVYWKLFDW
jgi:hypothetical protein